MKDKAAVMHGTHDVRLEDVPVPRCVRPAGFAVVVGMGPNEETDVPLAFIQTSEITLTGTFRPANTYPTAIDLDAMVTSHYGLADTEVALQASGKDPANAKPMVIPAPGCR